MIFHNAAVFIFTNVSLFNYEIVIHDVDDDDDDDNNDILSIFSFKVIMAWGKRLLDRTHKFDDGD